MNCLVSPESIYTLLHLSFTADVPALLYFSHIPTIIISLLVGLFVIFNGSKQLSNRLLFLVSLCFSTWTLINLLLWTLNNSDLMIFLWSLLGLLQGLIAVFSVYLVMVFIQKKDITNKVKVVFGLLLLPLLLFSVTDLNLSGYNLSLCDAFGFEGIPFYTYYTSLGIVAMIWVGFLIFGAYRKSAGDFRKQIVLMGMGMESFLFLFFVAVFLGSHLTEIGMLEDSSVEMYGLFGMTIFMVIIAFMIVQFHAFKVGILSSTALVIALIVLTASQLTFVETRTAIVLVIVTLALILVAGYLLVKSVRREVEQRQHLQVLTQQLAVANDRLKELDKLKSEFLSIASHQLRSPLTTMRGYSSLILEGSYGCFDERMKEPLERIHESAKLMATSIEDYLNVSRIESGNMKYNYSDFNLRDEVDKLCDDMRTEAVKKGLTLIFRSDLKGRGVVHADIGKTIQIVQNLITNSIKYTQQGSIKILVRDDVVRKKIYVDIIDTGIGIKASELESIFVKFERASNANTVNIHGTGLGLFVALKMAEAMGGGINVSSEGEGKGSCFTFDLPLAM